MTKTDDFYWYWLTNISGIGRGTVWSLVEYFGSPQTIYEMPENMIFPFLKREQQRLHFAGSKNEDEIFRKMSQLSEQNIRFLHPESPDYPSRLLDIPDRPVSLYLKGSLPLHDKKAIAIIGARSCTRYGREMARYFGRELAKYGVVVISGLACGIDGMAHRGALEGEGYTLGVVGGGVDRIYPKENYELFMELEKKGGILSESNVGVSPTAGLFPMRNRLIAGLSDGILVVEAMEKSGTFITVDQGLEQGKEIFALPGRVTDSKSAGCNQLIKMGAHIVTEVMDVLPLLHIEYNDNEVKSGFGIPKEEISKILLAPQEKMVYSCLEIEPKYIDCIINEVRLAPQEVSRTLNELVIRGVIAEPNRNYYAVKV